jgi:PAS domain-containing protein
MTPGSPNLTRVYDPAGSLEYFVLTQNVSRFRDLLSRAATDEVREVVESMLRLAEGELALLEAMERGVLPPWRRGGGAERTAEDDALRDGFHRTFDGSDARAALIDPAPGLKIVAVAGDMELAPGRSRRELVGQNLFDMFPDNPDGPAMRNVQVLFTALRAAADTGQEQTIAPYRHDLLDADGRFVERHWRGRCRPVNDSFGRLVFLLGLMENITDEVRGSPDL